MDCICSVLATLANAVVSALGSADTLTAPSDFGAWGRTDGPQTDSASSGFLNGAQTAALVILLLGAVVGTLNSRGGNLGSLQHGDPGQKGVRFPSDDRDPTGGGEVA